MSQQKTKHYTQKGERTTAQFNKEYKLTYKEYQQARQVAYLAMKQYNQKLYKTKTNNKQFRTYQQTLNILLSKDKYTIQDIIEKYNNITEQAAASREYNRLQQLYQVQEQYENILQQQEELQQQRLTTKVQNFITALKTNTTKALDILHSLDYDTQQLYISKAFDLIDSTEYTEVHLPDYIQ